tara:strand:+ start:90 stop:383 length:294 start_codon:yes stop_codon:yes gene_type:complete
MNIDEFSRTVDLTINKEDQKAVKQRVTLEDIVITEAKRRIDDPMSIEEIARFAYVEHKKSIARIKKLVVKDIEKAETTEGTSAIYFNDVITIIGERL